MKKITFLIVTALLSLSFLTANAKKWRVNNTIGIVADFTNPSVAVSSPLVQAGDTIYIEGSQTSYDVALSIYKPLVILGPGYFLNENPLTQNNKLSAVLNAPVYLYAGSSGSIIKGLSITAASFGESGLTNITIENNRIAGDITMVDGLSSIKISKNYVLGCLMISTHCTNLMISNNFIYYTYYYNNSITGGNFSQAIITNNIIKGGAVSTSYLTYVNNIFISCSISDTTTNSFANNICDGSYLPINVGNIRNANMADVFVGLTGNSTDGQWKLKAGSPAIGAALDGGDIGMFGGLYPYQLSGNWGPVIYNVFMPPAGTPATGINVTVKAKAN